MIGRSTSVSMEVRIPPGGVCGGSPVSSVRVDAFVQLGRRASVRHSEPHRAASAACRVMVNAGATDEQILLAFREAPEGFGALLVRRGEGALRRVITFARQGTQIDSIAGVLAVHASDEHRSELELELLDGPRAGQRFRQGIRHDSTAWAWLFRHAGFAVPAERTYQALGALVERRVGVRLERDSRGRLRVQRWLAPSAAEATRRVHSESPAPGTWTPRAGLEGPWDDALRALAARGVRVEPERWTAAVCELRERYQGLAHAGDERAGQRLRDLDSYADAVLEAALADPEQRVRAAWRVGSWTTRITSAGPNLQGITRAGGLRAAVVPAREHLFVVADWSCCQPRIAAGLSGDPALLEALAPGRDLYCAIGQLALGPVPPQLARPMGKALALPLLFGASNGKIIETTHHHTPGGILTSSQAERVRAEFAERFATLSAYRESLAGLSSFTSPLRHLVPVPQGRRHASGVLAGITQAWEADALRWVVQGSDAVMAGTGAEIAMLNHDEVVWEVPAQHAAEAAGRAGGWMLDCQSWVCAPCAPEVKVEVRSNWNKARTSGVGSDPYSAGSHVVATACASATVSTSTPGTSIKGTFNLPSGL
jgi:hypothetical protein